MEYRLHGNSTGEGYTGGSKTSKEYISNVLQSTTGNVYGIYDVVGGFSEYVASYIANSKNSNGYQFSSIDGLETSLNDKNTSTQYVTVYKHALDNDANNYNLNVNKIFGDGIGETPNWYKSYGDKFFDTTRPFMIRGGSFNYTFQSEFENQASDGANHGGYGSRVVCITE